MIHMQTNSDNSAFSRINYLTGSETILSKLNTVHAREPFDDEVIAFLNEVSRVLMSDREAKAYSDIVTFAFWIRKGSVQSLKERFKDNEKGVHLGKGVAFHIAPSNVPVNFAYSLVAGLLTGNANVVRIPTKEFPQVEILVRAFNEVLTRYPDMRPYVSLVRYGRDKEINDALSAVADVRIIWGGDTTISELRKSPLPPRSSEVTFADRYSVAIIDSDSYMAIDNKKRTAEAFYNDTYLTDQNACTSPRIIIWMGNCIDAAKKVFWENLHDFVIQKYNFQPIQGVNKLTSGYLIATKDAGYKMQRCKDNLIVRVIVPEITDYLMDYKDNSGFFFEYDCRDIMEIAKLCDDKRCQTIGIIGEGKCILPLIRAGVKGVDRVVPIGKTMDFDLIWDGYNLPALLTRTVVID